MSKVEKDKIPPDIYVYRKNFYLWMFISREGLWNEAKEFIEENMSNPSPFEPEKK